MTSDLATTPIGTDVTISTAARRAGVVLTVLVGAFLAFDTLIHVLDLPVAAQAMAELGYPPHANVVIGLVEAGCLLLFLVPRTAVLGAVVLTGYLGGAVATHLRAESPLFSTTLSAVYVGILVWLALWLRDPRVRALVRDLLGR